MATISIQDDDVDALVDGLADIHEMHELDLRDGPDLWYALANLVGALRDQKSATGTGALVGVRNRIDLEHLMVQKFRDWEKRRVDDDDGGQSADEVLEFQLANSGRSSDLFVGGGSASGSVTSFRYALDDSTAWTRYEVQLCASTKGEIADFTLGDIAHSLVLAG
ncbi:hypothetical protein O4H66_14570 [Comamonadaceae bacterium G21597-S1]|nr:hypothetical protein [Comamonadaceae bacterium G21597-S1]